MAKVASRCMTLTMCQPPEKVNWTAKVYGWNDYRNLYMSGPPKVLQAQMKLNIYIFSISSVLHYKDNAVIPNIYYSIELNI